MKCGVMLHCVNPSDWERVLAEDWERPPSPADHQLWDEVIELGDLIEPSGFDTIWTVEHFATPYGMVPSALQHLTFWAGRTQRIAMGTCVIVLPWHHPIQVAHEIAMLDIFLQGRDYTIGVGRGLSPKEFGPLGVPQDEARQRFDEALDIIKLGLSSQRFSYDGKIFQIPETSIRPQPRHADLWDRAVGGFMTDTSLEAIARAGLGPIVISPQSFEKVGRDTAKFNAFRAEEGLAPDAQPLVLMWGYCVEKEEDAQEGYQAFAQHGADGGHHYGFADSKSYSGIKGYEQYSHILSEMGKEQQPGKPAPRPAQLIGTPDQIIATVQEMQRVTGAREIAVNFNYGGLPNDKAMASLKLFAAEVLPAIHAIQAPPANTSART